MIDSARPFASPYEEGGEYPAEEEYAEDGYGGDGYDEGEYNGDEYDSGAQEQS